MAKPRPKAVGLSTPELHQMKIAKDTLRANDSMVGVMGGMTKDQARKFLKERCGWSQDRVWAWENNNLGDKERWKNYMEKLED